MDIGVLVFLAVLPVAAHLPFISESVFCGEAAAQSSTSCKGTAL